MEVPVVETINNWIKQAEHDFEMAQKIIDDGGYDTCAFLCQQALEKFLKTLYIYQKQSPSPKTHYIDELAKELSCPSDILEIAKELSADYMISRYPDAATSVPFEEYSEEDALDKVKKTKQAIAWIKIQIVL